MIEFLQDYTTEAMPPEAFKKGQQVERSEESERYFVGRGLAGYVVDGKLVNADHRPITSSVVAVEVVVPGDRRADLAVRAGEVMTGQPPRATSGPGTPFVEPADGLEGSPAVVLEAEVERLKNALATGDDLFREMNNSHVETNGRLAADVERLTRELADAIGKGDDTVTARDQALADLGAVRDQLATAEARVRELEQQLAEATAPKPGRGK